MALRVARIQEALDQGVPADLIVERLIANDEERAPGLRQALDAGFTGDQILGRLLEREGRGVAGDVTSQLAIRGAGGLVGSPRATAELVRFTEGALEDPVGSIQQVGQSIFGERFLPRVEAKETIGGRLGQLLQGQIPLGPDQEMPDTAFSKIAGAGRSILELLGIIGGRPEDSPFGYFGIEALPTGDEASQAIGKFLDIDPEAQTALGRIAGRGAQMLGESVLLGAPAAVELGVASTVGQTARELGAPEGVANAAELGSLFLRPGRAFEKTARLSESELAKFAEGLEKAAIEDFGAVSNPAELAAELESGARELIFDRIAPEVGLEEGLSSIREGVDTAYTRARAETSNLYNAVRGEVGPQALRNTTRTEKALADLDKTVAQSGLPATARESVLNAARELDAAVSRGMTIEEAISRKQNINALFDFDFPDLQAKANAKKFFAPVRKAFAEDLNASIRQIDKNTFANWRRAERSHARNAEIFGRDDVIRLQRAESPLDARNILNKPQGIEALKAALGDSSILRATTDRLALEELAERGAGKLSKREASILSSKLDVPSRQALSDLRNLEAPGSAVQKGIELQKRVLNDIAESASKGIAPEFTLKTMRTPEGLRQVRSALRRSSSGRKALKALEQEFASQVWRGVMDEAEGFRASEAHKLLGNKPLMDSLKSVEPRSTNFLKQLPELTARIENSLGNLSREQYSRIAKDPLKTSGLLLAASVFPKIGVPFAALKGAIITKELASRLLSRPDIQQKLRLLAIKPARVESILRDIGRIVERERQNAGKP